MKKTILIATAALMALSSAAASAQPRNGPYGDRDRDGRPNYADSRDNRDRYDNRDHRGPQARRHWSKGQRFDGYRNRGYMVNDYRSRGWRAPPRGYAYYRDNNSGDVVLAAIATGIIASVIANGR